MFVPFISDEVTCSKTSYTPSVVSAPGAPVLTGMLANLGVPATHTVIDWGRVLETST